MVKTGAGTNQPPFSAARWQHVSQVCFSTFILWIIANLLITRQPSKLAKIRHRFRILRILEKKLTYVWLNLKLIKFYFLKLAANFLWQPSYLLDETSRFVKVTTIPHLLSVAQNLTLLLPFHPTPTPTCQ